MAYATVTDVRLRLGRALTTAEEAQVTEWIDDLSADIRLRIADVVERAVDPDYARLVTRVIAETIIVKLRNPEGLRQHTESIDDYSIAKVVDGANSSGRLFISDDDWALLLPATSGDAFTITAYGAPDRAGYWSGPDTWVPLS